MVEDETTLPLQQRIQIGNFLGNAAPVTHLVRILKNDKVSSCQARFLQELKRGHEQQLPPDSGEHEKQLGARLLGRYDDIVVVFECHLAVAGPVPIVEFSGHAAFVEEQQILISLKALLEAEIVEGQPIDVDATTPLLGLGVMDSFSLLRFLALIESKFNVEIPLETLTIDRVKDLDSIVALIMDLTGDRS